MYNCIRSAPSNGSGGSGADVETDYQRTQYIPDEGVVGNSAKLREYDDQSSDEEEEIERSTKQQSAGSKLPSCVMKHTISLFLP